jgi:Cys-rich four helix bundle protein (predicted Tat secretion target)
MARRGNAVLDRLYFYSDQAMRRRQKEAEPMSDRDPMSKTHEQAGTGINRRQVLLGMGTAAAMAYAGGAAAAMPGHDHSKHSPQQPGLLDAVNNCLDKGRRCITHCLVAFQEGDVALADCAAKVHEMQAVCDAFSYLLAANSSYAEAYAPICRQVCEDCEKECLKHKEHIERKACAEACENVVDQIALTMK